MKWARVWMPCSRRWAVCLPLLLLRCEVFSLFVGSGRWLDHQNAAQGFVGVPCLVSICEWRHAASPKASWNAALSLGSGWCWWQLPVQLIQAEKKESACQSNVGKYLLASGLNTAKLHDSLINGAWFKNKAISLLDWWVCNPLPPPPLVLFHAHEHGQWLVPVAAGSGSWSSVRIWRWKFPSQTNKLLKVPLPITAATGRWNYAFRSRTCGESLISISMREGETNTMVHIVLEAPRRSTQSLTSSNFWQPVSTRKKHVRRGLVVLRKTLLRLVGPLSFSRFRDPSVWLITRRQLAWTQIWRDLMYK